MVAMINMLHIQRFMKSYSFIIVFFIGGCQGSQMEDLRSFVADAYKDRKPEIEPLPEIKPYKGYAYSAFNEADPFDSRNIQIDKAGAVGLGLRPDTNRRKEPLEAYPLDALNMVGTLSQQGKPWVIVQTSEGTAHRATVGNYMGQNEGEIKEIELEQQKVVITELVLDPAGRWVNRDVEFTIDEN